MKKYIDKYVTNKFKYVIGSKYVTNKFKMVLQFHKYACNVEYLQLG